MTTAACRGFVYATAVMGVTGARTTTSDLAGPLVARTRATTDLPVGVGLGVSNGDQAAEVASYADGVIVGSAFVRALLDHPDDRAAGLRALARPHRGPRRRGTACVEPPSAVARRARCSPGSCAGCGSDDAGGGASSTAPSSTEPYVVPDTAARPTPTASRTRWPPTPTSG